MTFGRILRQDRKKHFDKNMLLTNSGENDQIVVHQRGYNLGDLNKDIASVQNEKALKLSGGGYNLNMTL